LWYFCLKKQSNKNIQEVPSLPDDSSSFELKHRSLEALLDFVEHINNFETLEDATWHLAKHTIKELNFEDCVIYRLNDDQKHHYAF